MPAAGWYNNNEYRDFPFLTRTMPIDFEPDGYSSSAGSASVALNDLPHSAIVDMGVIMEINSGFQLDLGHYIYLDIIRRCGSTIQFEFRNTSPDALDELLVFTRDIADDEFSIEWADSTPRAQHAFVCGLLSSIDGSESVSSGSEGVSSSSSEGISSSSSESLSSETTLTWDIGAFAFVPTSVSASSSESSSESADEDTLPVSSSLSSSAAACAVTPKWSGFLVTGDLTELLESLPEDNDTLAFDTGLWRLEPAQIQSLVDSYLRTVNLANFPRTWATGIESCDSTSAGADILVHTECITGSLAFKPGYNCVIQQDDINNAIIIGGAVGEGEGEACEEIPLYEGEVGPDDGPFLTGGPTCTEILKTVSGKGGRLLRISAGPGFRVRPDTGQTNKLIIERNLDDFAACLESSGGA